MQPRQTARKCSVSPVSVVRQPIASSRKQLTSLMNRLLPVKLCLGMSTWLMAGAIAGAQGTWPSEPPGVLSGGDAGVPAGQEAAAGLPAPRNLAKPTRLGTGRAPQRSRSVVSEDEPPPLTETPPLPVTPQRPTAIADTVTRDVSDPSAGLPAADPNRQAAGPSEWWHQAISLPLGIGMGTLPISADLATTEALRQAPEVQHLIIQPAIERTEITRQLAAFEWNQFLETSWVDNNDPIGNTLTTGDRSERFRDQQLSGALGVRKRATSGAEWELAQRSGFQQNNSTFLIPNPQATARLELTLTQPLLEGRGRAFNYFRVVEATLHTKVRTEASLARLQDYLVDVATAYWNLYAARAEFLIRRRAAEHADALAVSLKERAVLDTTGRQLLRAQTAASQRRAELMRVAAQADLAAIRLRELIGHSDYETELLPTQPPRLEPFPFELEAAVRTAMAGRPEIAESIHQIRLAGQRVGVSRNQLLPRLDLIAGAYSAGLDGDRAMLDAFGRQFTRGGPGFNIGFVWERPAGNRAARSAVQRSQLALQDAMQQYTQAIQRVRADIQRASTRLDVGYQRVLQRRRALAAVTEELVFLHDRWRTSPDLDGPTIILLEQLIEAQLRRADEETALARAESDFNIAIIQWYRALGKVVRRTREDAMNFPRLEEQSLPDVRELFMPAKQP